MALLEKILKRTAENLYKYKLLVMIVTLLLTTLMVYGVANVEFESDFTKELPTQLPIYQLNDKITDKISGQDTIFVLLMLDESLNSKGAVKDIRDPEIISFITALQSELDDESKIDDVISFATVISSMGVSADSLSLETVKTITESSESARSFFSKDYTKTLMIISADVGKSEDQVVAITKLIQEKISSVGVPAGVEARITGTPSINITILQLLRHDSVYTIIIASAIILVLLFIIQGSVYKALLIFTPLMIGLVWTIGTLGLIGMKISVATAGIGAMILGLGVEYGVFMLTRFKEERSKGMSQKESLVETVPAVGSAILGSGTTTIVGFLALTLSIMPMLQRLGISLALGIFYCIISAVFIEPIIIIYTERFRAWKMDYNKKKLASIKVQYQE